MPKAQQEIFLSFESMNFAQLQNEPLHIVKNCAYGPKSAWMILEYLSLNYLCPIILQRC